MAQPEFWSDQNSSREKSKTHAHLKSEIESWFKFEADLHELEELTALATKDSDKALEAELKVKFELLTAQYGQFGLNTFLSGKYDDHDAILSIHAGAGGVDAQDWAQMLLRMYSRFAEAKTSRGRGGQSVNTTYSAIRAVHRPSGITVTIQNERSQSQNKEQALKILSAKLAALDEQKKEQERLQIRGEFHSAEWGNQIRSYVLHPYKLVKDHRTGYETSDAEHVLEGNLEEFIKKYLEKNK